MAQAARRDAWPPSGFKPGGDPDFAREQLLDEWDIDLAILNPLYGMTSLHHLDFGNALMRAVNEWTAATWLDSDARWLGSIVVNPNDPENAAVEIERAARDERSVQVLLLVRSSAPYGKRQFRPIFAGACAAGLPVGIHFGGSGNPITACGNPITACGWPSYYIEDHTAMSQAFEVRLVSIVCEGVFCEFPELRLALVEGGFAWLPGLMWRLDKNFRGLCSEAPWLKKLPSEYILEPCRATTQPMEEPEDPEHLRQIIEMIGREDFLMFATDYPHWDFDSPTRALPPVLGDQMRRGMLVRGFNS
ncbi:MAG: amidohydrolase family protein [Candidatus Latescibacteria bacterium]|nr:amidohydrolase family protein [Candidatus Latescibacterota bacterium]